jgi:signal transduction histidine kinase
VCASLSCRLSIALVIEQIEEITEAVTHSILKTREIAYTLRPFHLDRLGLTVAPGAMIKRAGNDSLHFATELDPIEGLLTPEQKIGFFHIVQGSLNNIISLATSAFDSLE